VTVAKERWEEEEEGQEKETLLTRLSLARDRTECVTMLKKERLEKITKPRKIFKDFENLTFITTYKWESKNKFSLPEVSIYLGSLLLKERDTDRRWIETSRKMKISSVLSVTK
jgi:hypothetical protein